MISSISSFAILRHSPYALESTIGGLFDDPYYFLLFCQSSSFFDMSHFRKTLSLRSSSVYFFFSSFPYFLSADDLQHTIGQFMPNGADLPGKMCHPLRPHRIFLMYDLYDHIFCLVMTEDSGSFPIDRGDNAAFNVNKKANKRPI